MFSGLSENMELFVHPHRNLKVVVLQTNGMGTFGRETSHRWYRGRAYTVTSML